jgi:membrane associated rhomboid family serine protease
MNTNKFPSVTWALVALCSFSYAASVFVSGKLTIDADTLTDMGAVHGPLSFHFFQYITYGFLHGSLLHLISNMAFLITTGAMLEKRIGGVKFLGLYLVCTIVPGILCALVIPSSVTIGASGALFGIMAATAGIMHMLSSYKTRFKYERNLVLGSIAINILVSVFVPGTNHLAHVVGLFTGLMYVVVSVVVFEVKKSI